MHMTLKFVKRSRTYGTERNDSKIGAHNIASLSAFSIEEKEDGIGL